MLFKYRVEEKTETGDLPIRFYNDVEEMIKSGREQWL